MKALTLKLKQNIQNFWKEEDGIGTLEIVLIIAVVVIIFLVFKDFIIEMVDKFIKKAETGIDSSFDKRDIPNSTP